MICPKCRQTNQPGSARCGWCGHWMVQGPAVYAPLPNDGGNLPRNNPPGNADRNWAAITGMVCGIASILCSMSLFGSLFLGAAAIIFSAMGRKSAHKGMAIAGLVCGIVGLAITVLLFPFLYNQIIEQIENALFQLF